MKNYLMLASVAIAAMMAITCSKPSQETPTIEAAAPGAGQSAVQDNESQPNIVQIAVASPNHTTLVTALKAAQYVDVLSNAGPFTVFAPTDEAFAKLPAGTVEDLVKPENKSKLQNILEYHVYVGVIRESMVNGTMSLNQVNGENVLLKKESDKMTVNGATILGTINTSNGIVYVIDSVLLLE